MTSPTFTLDAHVALPDVKVHAVTRYVGQGVAVSVSGLEAPGLTVGRTTGPRAPRGPGRLGTAGE